MTQDQLARAAGMDRSYVGRIERGEKGVCLKSLIKLSRALHVPVVDLLVWLDGNPSAEQARHRLKVMQERLQTLLPEAAGRDTSVSAPAPLCEVSIATRELEELARLAREALDHLDRALGSLQTAEGDEE